LFFPEGFIVFFLSVVPYPKYVLPFKPWMIE
jgi:hypothetical protein